MGSMADVRPFQFLVGVRGIVDRRTLTDAARTAESIGYSGVTIHDHLTAQMAPIPVLTAIAMATERLRLYPFVFNNDLRQDRESLPDAFPDRMDVRVGWIRESAGSRFVALDLNVIRLLGGLIVTDAPLKAAAEVARRYETATGLVIPPTDILESPNSLIGTVPDLVAKLRATRDRWGINSWLVGWMDEPELADFAPVVEQLAGT
jgi:hypothetical protein